MAHSCPRCDQACACGGDIDDVVISGTVEETNCEHCGCLLDEDEDDDVGEDHDEDDDTDDEDDDEIEYVLDDWPEWGYEVED